MGYYRMRRVERSARQRPIDESKSTPKNYRFKTWAVSVKSANLIQNVSICQSVIISCFDFKGQRNKIVYDDMNFPSVMYVYEAQKANGARIEMVKSDDGITVSLQKMLDVYFPDAS